MDIHAKTASDLVNFLFKHKPFTFLPQLSQIAKIFASIPVTSSVAERSFSTLRRLKSFLHSTMGQTRLSSMGIIIQIVSKFFTDSIMLGITSYIDVIRLMVFF